MRSTRSIYDDRKDMKYTFKRPYTFEGTEYTELDIGLEGLGGADMDKINEHFKNDGNHALVSVIDHKWCRYTAQYATGKPAEFFGQMPGGEYTKMMQEVSNFFLHY